MDARERVIRTLEFDKPDRAPRDLWYLDGVGMYRAAEVEALLKRFPSDFAAPEFKSGPSRRMHGERSKRGQYVDEWGCLWNVAEDGVIGEIKRPIFDDWSAMDGYEPPWELIDGADFSGVDPSCAATDKFTRAGGGTLFERMQYLRGTENLFMDFLTQPPELAALCDLVHGYNLRLVDRWCATAVDAISFNDDWGSQQGLLIDPGLWRSVFKPRYSEYFERVHAAGKSVFFHSDGYIREIIPDLIELGVNALNSQLFCMDIEEIGRSFKGKITFWGEICRQNILPFGSVEDVRAAVRRVRNALDDGQGGVIAQCEWGNNDPMENIAAVFETWLEPRPAARQPS